MHSNIYLNMYIYLYRKIIQIWISHRGIIADHGINVDQHSKPRNVQILYTVFALVSWF
jgi:hypothetical protein